MKTRGYGRTLHKWHPTLPSFFTRSSCSVNFSCLTEEPDMTTGYREETTWTLAGSRISQGSLGQAIICPSFVSCIDDQFVFNLNWRFCLWLLYDLEPDYIRNNVRLRLFWWSSNHQKSHSCNWEGLWDSATQEMCLHCLFLSMYWQPFYQWALFS